MPHYISCKLKNVNSKFCYSAIIVIIDIRRELEQQRTRTSLSLTEEKQLLKKIHAGERDRRQLQEYLDYDQKIQLRKTQLGELRDALKVTVDEPMADLEQQATKARLAIRLGCQVKDLAQKEIECPAEKMGKVIGKAGATVKKIEEKAGVSLDVDPEKNVIVINGSSESFAIAEREIAKIIMQTEENVEVPPSYIQYLTNAKGNVIVKEMKEAHPDVHFDVNRRNKTIPMRGMPEDIAKVKSAMIDLGVIQQEKEVTPAEAQIIIGKKGSNIEQITAQYNIAIEVEKGEDASNLIVVGPESEVEAAMKAIESLVADNAEATKTIPCGRAVAQAFLTANGFRVKELSKKINESTEAQNTGRVNLSFDKTTGDNVNLLIKGKNSAMGTAVAMVGEAIREIDTDTVRIMADTHAVPQIIGKGGENIKKLKEGRKINIEVDKKTGEIAINGLDKEEVAEAEKMVLAIIAENKVVKIPVDPSIVDSQYRDLIRSKTRQEIKDLARLDLDKAESKILLRGPAENVEKAAEMIMEFLASNFLGAVEITDADRDLLLAGGKESKIVSLSKELEVNLSVDKASSSIQVRGTEDKVKAAVGHINNYLFGGEGNIACKIAVAKEALGVIIGKGGKTRKELEAKYPEVSMYIHRSGDAVTIRGPEEIATTCRNEIVKMISSARINEVVEATEEQMKNFKKSNVIRKLVQHIPVQCTLEKAGIKVRGISSDVSDAVALIKEHMTGIYESTLELGESQFAKLKASSRDPSHLTRMESSSGAKISLRDSDNAVLVSGTKATVKKAKLQVLDFLAFLVPGEFSKIKIPKVMHATVGEASTLSDISAETGANVFLDRDLSMIIVQSAEKDIGWEATKAVQAKVAEAEKLVYVFEFETSEAWLIPMLIGTKGSRINAVRKESGCNIEINKESRTVVIAGTTEESVALAKTTIQDSVDKAKKENIWVEVPEAAIPRFVGKGGAHIAGLREKYGVEIETMRKGSMVKITGEDDSKVAEAKEAIEAWVAEWAKPVEKKEVKIERHHISAIIGKGGANIQALQEEFGCRIDLDRDSLVVGFRGDPVKQEMALKRIEEIMTETPAPERVARTKSEDEEEGDKESQPTTPTKGAQPKKQDGKPAKAPEGPVDPEEQKDRTKEFPSLPIGLAASGKKKRNRKRNKKAGGFDSAGTTPTKSTGASSGEESSMSDEDDKIIASHPAVIKPVAMSAPVFVDL